MRLRKPAFIFVFLLFSLLLSAHPHLFIKPSIEIETRERSIKGIRFSWEWDKWWSQEVINGCDLDKNGVLSEKEISLVYNKFFIGVKELDFFTEIFINGKKIKISNVINFNAELKNGIAFYYFTVPLEVNIENGIKFKICFNDETVYTAFDKNIIISQNTVIDYGNLKREPYNYYGMQISFDLVLK